MKKIPRFQASKNTRRRMPAIRTYGQAKRRGSGLIAAMQRSGGGTADYTARSYGKVAGKYDSQMAGINMGWPYRKKFAKLAGNGFILDAGCATGIDAEFFARLGFRAIGIDSSKEMIDSARRRRKAGTFRVMRMENLKEGEEKFSGIWASQSFHHIERRDAEKVLRNFRSALRKGGILFLTAKAGEGSFCTRRGIGGAKFMQGLPRRITLYTKAEMLKLLEKAGFRVRSIQEKTRQSDKTSWLVVFAIKPRIG